MNTNVIKEIYIGSLAFFSKYKDFVSSDIDILYIIDKPFFGDGISVIRENNKDMFLMYINADKTSKNLIDEIKDYYQACKFLVTEFIEYINSIGINFTIEDLKIIRPFFDNVKNKHLYTQYICDTYIKNNGFFLTDEQLDKAYKIYKENKEQ